jgi:putative FmdB family regulatory protein
MPTYEYRCGNCGHEFEQMQSIKADPLKICPRCNGESLRRLLGTGSGLIFKGSGFYITDYKKNGNGGTEGTSPNGGSRKSDKKSSPEPSAAPAKPAGVSTDSSKSAD